MYFELKKMKVILTGANSGMGYEITKELLKKKFTVIAIDQNTKNLSKLKNSNLFTLKFNLENFHEYSQILNKIFMKFNYVDCLINNARYQEQANFEKENIETWDKTMNINLKSAFFLSKEFIKNSVKKNIKIINISSVADEFITNQSPSYHCSKSGIKILTKYLSTIDKNIICNSISPGFIVKNRAKKYFSKTKISKTNKAIQDFHPGKKVGSTNDVLKAILFFLTESSSYINGQNIKVDGGLSNIEHIEIIKNFFND